MKKSILYFHGGSGNHGCEALARAISSIVNFKKNVILCSKNPEEEFKYIADRIDITIVNDGKVLSIKHPLGFISACRIKFLKQHLAWVKPAHRTLLKIANKNCVAYSIGGDNYCYDGVPEVLSLLNKKLNKKGAKTVLFGCSVEPELLNDSSIVEDMSNYALITARESITYNALKEAKVKTDVILAPDPAFTLPISEGVLPDGFVKGNTVGINISPLILNYGSEELFDAYCTMIQHILESTDMQIALIPHVVWADNNDFIPIQKIYDHFNQDSRLLIIPDSNATTLKWYISQCRMFIGARTHSTIAAYSTCVPTLVIGYSVKSKGIARDLFGTEQNYVIDSNTIKSGEDLIDAFEWLKENEKQIKEHLEKIMPDYIQRVYLPVEKLKKLHTEN